MSNWVEIVRLWPQADSTPDAQGIAVLLREASDGGHTTKSFYEGLIT
jgi:hypothetical protein